MFGISMFDKHTKSTAFHGLVQIMRQTISNLDMGNISKPSYGAYHRYKGLSSIPNLGGNREDIPDTKHSIYKHYISDMRIFGYEGLADMKV
jgi:hypothetical protein